jgi:glycolate oxidase
MTWQSELQNKLPYDAYQLGPNETYAKDASPLEPTAPPLAIVFPTTDAEVQQCLQVAQTHQLTIIPRGAGTGTTGGALVTTPAIILSFERMNKILEIDLENRIAVVEPGVITEHLQNAVESKNLFYPPDPASKNRCTIGGNIAENAGGPRALKYGVTGNYVTGLSGFYIDGTPFHFGGKLYKNVAGYDLMRLLIGSEGTLAIITKIYLRLIPLPEHIQDILITFPSLDDAIGALQKICTSHIHPSAAEFMPENQLIIQLDAGQNVQTIKDIATQHHAISICVAETKEDSEKIWQERRAMSESLKASAVHKISHDIVVPPASIAAYLKEAKKIGENLGLNIIGYGHLGDGNIHLNILNTNPNVPNISEAFQKATELILKLAVSMGGSITGEHGIGLTKKAYLPLMFSEKDIETFQGLKKIFDPESRLNTGKVL